VAVYQMLDAQVQVVNALLSEYTRKIKRSYPVIVTVKECRWACEHQNVSQIGKKKPFGRDEDKMKTESTPFF